MYFSNKHIFPSYSKYIFKNIYPSFRHFLHRFEPFSSRAPTKLFSHNSDTLLYLWVFFWISLFCAILIKLLIPYLPHKLFWCHSFCVSGKLADVIFNMIVSFWCQFSTIEIFFPCFTIVLLCGTKMYFSKKNPKEF